MSSRSIQASIAVLGLALALSGCARKVAESPPQATVATASPAEAPVPVPESAPPTPVEFQSAFFSYNSYALDANSRASLDADVHALREQPNLSVVVEGHCDERGTVEYNQTLGERRANAARDYLVASGIDRDRIQTISYGKERPFVEGQGEQAWSQNRRAHVVLR